MNSTGIKQGDIGRSRGVTASISVEDYGFDPFEYRVYIELLRYANGKQPETLDQMAASCQMSRRKVVYCLKSFELAGIIDKGSQSKGMPFYSLKPEIFWVDSARFQEIRKSVYTSKQDS